MVSDATGETVISAARAVCSQFTATNAVEHVYPLVRNVSQLEKVINCIEKEPGIVIFTLINQELTKFLEEKCAFIGTPCISILEPIIDKFQNYLGESAKQKAGAQHTLDHDYFKRIEALNFTMAHDDGVIPEDIEEADIVLLGISRTSKTPTSIYLANRGFKTANIPLVTNYQLPQNVIESVRPLIVALVATPDQIYHVRQNRMLGLNAINTHDNYTNRAHIAEELSQTRKLCKHHAWPMIDVSRKSIEETSAAIIELHARHVENLNLG